MCWIVSYLLYMQSGPAVSQHLPRLRRKMMVFRKHLISLFGELHMKRITVTSHAPLGLLKPQTARVKGISVPDRGETSRSPYKPASRAPLVAAARGRTGSSREWKCLIAGVRYSVGNPLRQERAPNPIGRRLAPQWFPLAMSFRSDAGS